jgi:hypothetical protein
LCRIVGGGKLLVDDPTGGVTGLSGCSASGTQLNRGPISALTARMVVNGSRSGAGVEPTEPWVTRPHWF